MRSNSIAVVVVVVVVEVGLLVMKYLQQGHSTNHSCILLTFLHF